MRELEGKRSAEISRAVRLPATAFVSGRTHHAVARKIADGIRSGRFSAASEILYRKGGGYVAKVTIVPRRERPTSPRWAAVCVRIGLVLIGISLALSVLAFALSALIGAVLSLPWLAILGAAGFVAILAAVTRPGRAFVEVIVRVTTK